MNSTLRGVEPAASFAARRPVSQLAYLERYVATAPRSNTTLWFDALLYLSLKSTLLKQPIHCSNFMHPQESLRHHHCPPSNASFQSLHL